MTENAQGVLLANRDLEYALAAALVVEPEVFPAVSDVVSEEDFYFADPRRLFQAMSKLVARGGLYDAVTVQAAPGTAGAVSELTKLYSAGMMESYLAAGGDMPDWIEIIKANTIPGMATRYAAEVRDLAVRRRLRAAASTVAMAADDQAVEVVEAVARAEKAVFDASARAGQSRVRTGYALASEALDQFSQRYAGELPPPGEPTGFRDLDALLGGIRPYQMIVIGGRPGMGKSTLAAAIASNFANRQKRVAILSMEMSANHVMNRLVSAQAGVPLRQMESGSLSEQEWSLVTRAVGQVSQWHIWIDDSSGLSPEQVRTKVSRLHYEHALDLVVIDYLQLMVAERLQGEQEISHISRSLKALALTLNVPIIAISQLSRGVESRADKRPQLQDLRGSGSLEQDADIVAFAYRDEYYRPDTSERPNVLEVIVAKNRDGALGTADLYWNGPAFQIKGLSRVNVNL